MEGEDVWGKTFDETTVHIERVIAYWSRSLKSAERNYSATEREALGAKEALVRFQLFIEGEQVILVTDHAALQWARVYENANRRLAAWGAVFAAYPGLKIMHRPGRVHSNVDPLSRLPRVPAHASPIRDDLNTIVPDAERQKEAQRHENKETFAPAKKAAFVVLWLEEVVDKYAYPIQTRRQKKNEEEAETSLLNAAVPETEESIPSEVREEPAAPESVLPFPADDPWTYPVGIKPPKEDAWNAQAHLLVSISPAVIHRFKDGYEYDPYFKSRYAEEVPNPDKILTPSRFQKGKDRLLYFVDADWNHRLCVPRSEVNFVLKWIHDSPHESVHSGPEKFEARLREVFFWTTLHHDVEEFARSCDVCQKIKTDHRQKMGGLRPSHVPARPFATVSMDLVTGLPPSGKEKFTAILVIVDKLTRFGIMIPTHTTLSQEGFAKFFVDRIVNVYGMPERIISDRNKRWATAFWRSVVAQEP
jgi:hypothetical protein